MSRGEGRSDFSGDGGKGLAGCPELAGLANLVGGDSGAGRLAGKATRDVALDGEDEGGIRQASAEDLSKAEEFGEGHGFAPAARYNGLSVNLCLPSTAAQDLS